MDRIKLIKKLFNKCSGYIELRALLLGKKPKIKFVPLNTDWETIRKEVDKFCKDYKDQNLYFGIATRDSNGGAETNVISIPCVWAEIDYKHFPDAPETTVCAIIDKFPFRPTIIIKSGGGLHLYWLFDKPVDLKMSKDVRAANDWLRLELSKLCGCELDKVGDIPRVFRLPDTVNHKYGYKPLCEVAEINSNTYKIEDFLGSIPESFEIAKQEINKDPLKELYKGSKKGSRNNDLTKIVGSLVRDGLNFDECLETARVVNSRNNPPLNEDEIQQIIKSIIRKHDRKLQTTSTTLNLTDFGNTNRLVSKCGDIVRYCYPWKKWLVWDEDIGIWQVDNNGRIIRLAKGVIRNIYYEASALTDTNQRETVAKWALKSEAVERLRAMVELAKSEEGVPVSPNELDTNQWLLNCSNGTVDLRTGELKVHDKNDLITKIIPVEYNPEADCPLWIDFLEKIMNYNYGLISFLQRAIGYSLTGNTSEQCLFLLYGVGANGKSTFLKIISDMLWDYSQAASFDSFLVKKNSTANNDIARMQGRRFITAVEAEGERRLAEVLIKQLTGGDTITARFLFSEFFEFVPQFKLWLAANHKPTIKGTDHAIWRRIKLIPFDVTIPDGEIDKKLTEKLREELPGVLSWAVQGCLEWQANGLESPEEVINATNDYRNEMDDVGTFLEECCILQPNVKVNPTDLYDAYKKWCECAGETVLSHRAFGTRLTGRGLKATQSGGKRFRVGIGLLENSTACTT